MSPERLPETSPDGANLGFGAHEFTPAEPVESPRPTPDTSGAGAEPPVPPEDIYKSGNDTPNKFENVDNAQTVTPDKAPETYEGEQAVNPEILDNAPDNNLKQ